MHSVFIVDHRPVLRLGLRYLVEQIFKDVHLTDFSSIYDLPPVFEKSRIPELIFLGAAADLRQLQFIPKLKATYGNTKLIVYDPEGKAEEAIKFLRSGANGYLSKSSDLETINNCIKHVMSDKFYIDPVDMHALVEALVGNRENKRHMPSRSPLTSRQNEIASLLAQGLGTSKIANKLGLKSSTVSTVKATIYEKLKVDSVIGIRKLILENGGFLNLK